MAVYDATNPEARKYYWDLMDKALFNIGIDAWWLDTTEPETKARKTTFYCSIDSPSAAAIATSTCTR